MYKRRVYSPLYFNRMKSHITSLPPLYNAMLVTPLPSPLLTIHGTRCKLRYSGIMDLLSTLSIISLYASHARALSTHTPFAHISSSTTRNLKPVSPFKTTSTVMFSLNIPTSRILPLDRSLLWNRSTASLLPRLNSRSASLATIATIHQGHLASTSAQTPSRRAPPPTSNVLCTTMGALGSPCNH